MNIIAGLQSTGGLIESPEFRPSRAPAALLLTPVDGWLVHAHLTPQGLVFKSAHGAVAVPMDELLGLVRAHAPEILMPAKPAAVEAAG